MKFQPRRALPSTPERRLSALLSDIEEGTRTGRPLPAVLDLLSSSKLAIFQCLSDDGHVSIVAKVLTLKILNLCLAKYHYLSRSSMVLSHPLGLIIDPSNVCNLACPGCVHSPHSKELQIFSWGKGNLPENRFSAFLRRYGPAAIHCNFCNYGEPLVNPETPKFIRQAKGFLVKTMLSTSLSLPHVDAEAYVASGLDYMLVSIDGATQPVYEKFRRKGRLDLALANLRKFADAKRKLGKRTPLLAWRFITFEHNIHEIPQAIELAREHGADQFLTLEPYDVTWDLPEMRGAAIEPINLALNPDAQEGLLANWNPFPDGLDIETIDRAFDAPYAFVPGENGAPGTGPSCHWLYQSMTMDAGGRIIPCCAAPRPDIDLEFAAFDNGASSDVFNSEKYRLARLAFSSPETYRAEMAASGLSREPHCANCTWNKETPNTDGIVIRQYLNSTARGLFTEESLAMLSSW